MADALRQISEAEFSPLLQHDFSARAWLSRWLRTIPAYLDWQRASELEGWRYSTAESAFNLPLNGIQLRGRIDRLDQRGAEKRVLDYKTQNNQILSNKLQLAGEDVQLAGYAWALQADEAAFVSLEVDKVKTITPKHELAQLAELNASRLEQLFQQLRAGESLPANGVDAQCTYCEMRGLCRKGEWASE
jgi:ATP-dependent helicase/nuclease subunit B